VRSTDTQTLLKYEAKRSPDLLHMIENLNAMTNEDIRAAKVKLPWIRNALLDLKKRGDDAKLNESLAQHLERYIVDGFIADLTGETRRWNADGLFVKIGRTQLQMKQGQLIWFDGTGIWIDTIYTTVIDPLLLRHTTSLGRTTRSEYMNAVRNDIRQRDQTTTPAALDVSTGTQSQTFQIFRPG
jgi:hypothetical protein